MVSSVRLTEMVQPTTFAHLSFIVGQNEIKEWRIFDFPDFIRDVNDRLKLITSFVLDFYEAGAFIYSHQRCGYSIDVNVAFFVRFVLQRCENQVLRPFQ